MSIPAIKKYFQLFEMKTFSDINKWYNFKEISFEYSPPQLEVFSPQMS